MMYESPILMTFASVEAYNDWWDLFKLEVRVLDWSFEPEEGYVYVKVAQVPRIATSHSGIKSYSTCSNSTRVSDEDLATHDKVVRLVQPEQREAEDKFRASIKANEENQQRLREKRSKSNESTLRSYRIKR